MKMTEVSPGRQFDAKRAVGMDGFPNNKEKVGFFMFSTLQNTINTWQNIQNISQKGNNLCKKALK